MRTFFLMIAIFCITAFASKATRELCDKNAVDLLIEVGKVHEQCHEILRKLEGDEYLWKWQWHHKSCASQPLKCSKLTNLETDFTLKDYKEHLYEGREYIGDTTVRLNKRIRTVLDTHPTKKFCSELSLDIQGLAAGCRSIEKHLGERLKEIEEAYQAVF